MHYPSNLGKNLFQYFRVELFSKVQFKILGAVSLLLKNPRECDMLVHKPQSCEQRVVCTPSNSLLVAFLLAHSHIRLSHRFLSQRETAHSLSFAPLKCTCICLEKGSQCWLQLLGVSRNQGF